MRHEHGGVIGYPCCYAPNRALRRTPAAAPPSPVSFQTLGVTGRPAALVLTLEHSEGERQ
jgi:hypothetical protein